MRNFKVLLIALVSASSFTMQTYAQSCGELFQRANNLREKENYADAILYYERAKNCDSNLKTDCDKWIKYCKENLDKLDIFDSESKEQIQTITIPYQGGDKELNVVAKKKWVIEGNSSWCNVEEYDNKSFVVQCREANNSTREKITMLTIKSGSLFKTLKVVQAARPEYIDVAATSLSFPANGTEQTLGIESNANWDVSSIPSWCKVTKDSLGIKIVVAPNENTIERTDDIVIISPSNKSVTVKIYQGAGNETLALSRNNIHLASEGDVCYIKVYTDAENWFIGDYPTWMNVQRVGEDSIRIECGKNIPNGENRTGSVQVKTDRQTTGVLVTQNPRMPVDVIFKEAIVSGRNFSLGLSASYYMPFVSTNAGGDYVGSIVDYSMGTDEENASYKSAYGYSLGLFADIRLYKNIYLITGVNFSQIGYKNSFNGRTTFTTPYTKYEYMKGEVDNDYEEEYKHTMLEVPILASYRFKVNDVSHVQLDFGPVLNFGLSAEMNLSGNTDSETLKRYNSVTHQRVDNNNYVRHTGVNADFNLYQPCVLWTESHTTGNVQDVEHHDKFTDNPLKRFNYGLRLGAAYEISGLSFGLYYTMMLSNMANDSYWENKRWSILNESNTIMSGYKQRIHTLEFKLAYTLRYLKF